MTTIDLEDYLTVDPPIINQQYGLITYILPDPERNELQYPLIKLRGNFPTVEACKKRVERLKVIDQELFTIVETQVGMFTELTPHKLINDQKDIIHRESRMNDLVKGYVENQEKSKLLFDERVNHEKRQKKYFNEKMDMTTKEHPIAVKERIETCQHLIKQLKQQLQQQEELLKNSEMKYLEFTDEELREAEEEYNQNIKNVKETKELTAQLDEHLEIDDIYLKRNKK